VPDISFKSFFIWEQVWGEIYIPLQHFEIVNI
jgi:hypothetical protein